MKISKEEIVKMKDEIYAFAKKYGIGRGEFCVFFNGKMTCNVSKNWRKTIIRTKDNVNPLDYCEYFPEEFILGLAYDGPMYDVINGYAGNLYDEFTKIFESRGLYLEHCDGCHAAVCNSDNDENDIEYTVLKKEEINYIYRDENAPDELIRLIMKIWYELSKAYGDVGGCVIGAYLEFVYKDKKYRMMPQSPYQGSCSWESGVEIVKNILKEIGSTDIYFNYGRLD